MLGAHKKSPSANAKGLEIVSSPYWKGLELFVGVKLLKNCETSIN
jgi:hypothetical protein